MIFNSIDSECKLNVFNFDELHYVRSEKKSPKNHSFLFVLRKLLKRCIE